MRILLWHGYLLGGTGSNVYTRMLAREWSNAGHHVTVLSQEPQPGAVRPRHGRHACGPTSADCCPCSSSTATTATTCGASRTARAPSSKPGWRRTPAPSSSSCPPMSSSRTTSSSAARSGQRAGAPFAVKAHGSELEYSMRGNAGAVGVGGGGACARECDVRRVRAHPHRARRGLRAHRARLRGAARRRYRRVGSRADRDVAARALVDEACHDVPNPGNAQERLPDEGNAERFERLLPRGRPSSSTSAS